MLPTRQPANPRPARVPRRRERGAAPRAIAAALVLAALVAAGASAAKVPFLGKRAKAYDRGQEIEITGVVTDAEGLPLADLRVRLEAWRAEFSVLKMGWERRDPARIATDTAADGSFTLTWPWHEFYNRFELQLGMMVREAGGETFLELARADLSDRIYDGTPVVQSLTVADRREVDAYRAFLAGIDSDDQRELFDQLGRPDREDRLELAGRVEVTWWYFRSGKAYRFQDGRLVQVIPFDPVTSF